MNITLLDDLLSEKADLEEEVAQREVYMQRETLRHSQQQAEILIRLRDIDRAIAALEEDK